MIEMREARDRQVAVCFEIDEKMRERHRIGSARQRDDDARAPGDQIVVANETADSRKEVHCLSSLGSRRSRT